MKKLIYLSLLCAVVCLSSCNHAVYPTKTLQNTYELGMTSKHEIATMAKIQVFLSDKDIVKPFDVISINTYRPLLTIPILAPYESSMRKNFYKAAIKKAEDQLGDAIIITGIGQYKVLKYK